MAWLLSATGRARCFSCQVQLEVEAAGVADIGAAAGAQDRFERYYHIIRTPSRTQWHWHWHDSSLNEQQVTPTSVVDVVITVMQIVPAETALLRFVLRVRLTCVPRYELHSR